jgi:hypothetical protein
VPRRQPCDTNILAGARLAEKGLRAAQPQRGQVMRAAAVAAVAIVVTSVGVPAAQGDQAGAQRFRARLSHRHQGGWKLRPENGGPAFQSRMREGTHSDERAQETDGGNQRTKDR